MSYTIRNMLNITKCTNAKVQTRKQVVSNFITITLIALLVLTPVILVAVNAAPGEPTIEEVLNTLGFTNITEVTNETFSAGSYNVTLYAEFAGYHLRNQLDYYAVNTTNYQTIFLGPVGATGDQGGYVVPPVSTIFTSECEFGLSMLAPSYRYFTEHDLNPDYPLHHAIVYQNLNNPTMYLIGFENFYGDSERDYNDMVFSLVPTQPPQIVSVSRDPLTPNVNEAVTVSATVTKGSADITSVILGYQVGSGSWNNVTMSLVSGSYVATIPGQAAWATVNYKVYATDAAGLSDVSAVYSYTVNVVPLSIVSVTRDPLNPQYDQTVTVSANVTKGSADIDSVILEYQVGSGNKVNITMSLNSGLYVANIPAQTSGVTVNYKVYANDTLGLNDISALYTYTVSVVPPTIVSVTRVPLNPQYDQTVTVYANVTKGNADIDSVILEYQIGSGSKVNVTMNLNSGLYVATIPAQTSGVTVNYKVYANDILGLNDISALYSYTVSVVPLSIVSVTRVPVNPDYDQAVTVSANVTKGNADIDAVILEYQVGSGSKVNITMSLNSGLYVATIPAQASGVTVSYKVYANDTLGLSDVSALFSYTVSSVPPVIVSVTRSPLTPNFDQSVTVKAKVTKGVADITSVILGYKAGSGSWVNVTMNLNGGLYVATIPNYTYGTTVNYQVYATDAAGLFDVSTVYSYTVNPNMSPVADFTESANIVYTGQVINFDASGSYDVDGHIISYTWSFGDGTTATGVTTSHAYTTKSPYSVSLTVVDNYGASSTLTKGVLVTNRPPVAILNASSTIVDSKEVISFTAVASYDLDGTIVSYEWDFGDRSRATGMNVTHTFPRGGEYIVKLTVTDNDGATGTAVYPKIVDNIPPVAVIDQSSGSVYPDGTVSFNAANSFDPDGTIVAYEWNFGDGTTAVGSIVSHVYTTKGTYVVTLTVTDNDGATGTADSTVTVMNIAPNAVFTDNANVANTEQTISFDASRSSDPDGTIVNYLWDFGDGTTATGVEVDHAYGQTGTYTVTLTVTDNDGATDSTSETKTVTNQPPVAVIAETQATINNGEAAQLDASESYDLDGTITSYLWDFGDGTTATTVEADHTYESTGVYTVTLTVTDNNGATDMATTTITVVNSPPEAVFTQSATTVTQGEAVSFDASESYDTDGTIVTYEWDFGDGTTATGVEVDHTFTQSGDYTVTLTVTDNGGASSSTTADTSVQDAVVSLAIIGFMVLGVTALTLTLLYGLFIRRRKKKQNNQ